ncbi:MAG: hypothetical protein IRY99_04375 [Isosphaeraceae bacterium]|nr:hypothetical protein [Isosphaeraceae bacterium]
MSTAHDIYNPPPAPIPWTPPPAEPLRWTAGDLTCLAALVLALAAASAWAWSFEPTLGASVTLGGLFVVLESWFSALTFLQRHPDARSGRFWLIYAAALVPWGLALGGATALMLALFAASDWAW